MAKIDYSIGDIVPMHELSACPDEHYGHELARLLAKLVEQVAKAAMDDEIKRAYRCECGDQSCPTLECVDYVIEKALLILYFNHRGVFRALRTTNVDDAIKVAEKSFGKLGKVFDLVGEVEVQQGGLLSLRIR